MTQEALRFNTNKARLSYILQFPHVLEAIARIMEFGATKYEDGNWKKGGKPDAEYLNSGMRHLTEWVNHKKFDPDSGCAHLGMAIWNLMALLELNHPEEIKDDELFRKQCDYWAAEKLAKMSPSDLDINPVEVQGEDGEVKYEYRPEDYEDCAAIDSRLQRGIEFQLLESQRSKALDGLLPREDGLDGQNANFAATYGNAPKVLGTANVGEIGMRKSGHDVCDHKTECSMCAAELADELDEPEMEVTFELPDMSRSSSFQHLINEYFRSALVTQGIRDALNEAARTSQESIEKISEALMGRSRPPINVDAAAQSIRRTMKRLAETPTAGVDFGSDPPTIVVPPGVLVTKGIEDETQYVATPSVHSGKDGRLEYGNDCIGHRVPGSIVERASELGMTIEETAAATATLSQPVAPGMEDSDSPDEEESIGVQIHRDAIVLCEVCGKGLCQCPPVGRDYGNVEISFTIGEPGEQLLTTDEELSKDGFQRGED